jgi:hypothetical protein
MLLMLANLRDVGIGMKVTYYSTQPIMVRVHSMQCTKFAKRGRVFQFRKRALARGFRVHLAILARCIRMEA